MIKCEICRKDLADLRGFSIHLKFCHNMTAVEYYKQYIVKDLKNKCKICEKETRFINIEKGFSPYCSVSCANKDPKRKLAIINKTKEKYGNEYTNPSQVPEIMEKKKKTLLKHYGVVSPLQSPEIKNKFFETNQKRYGFDYPMSNKDIRIKAEKKCKEKYGVEKIMKLPLFKEKSKSTCKKKFGCEFASQNPEIKKNMREVAIRRSYKLLLESDRLKGKFIPLFTLDEYNGTDNYQVYKWKCLICNTEFEAYADNGLLPRCPTCNPVHKFQSSYEKEIIDFLSENNIDCEQGNRSILSGGEIDIYVPSKKIAIEVDGLFWHSEICGKKHSLYHLNKTEKCEKNGISLIHVFEDEWVQKKNIVKSILKNKLGITKNLLFARKCELKSVSFEHANLFILENHLQGTVNFKKSYGLYYNDKLVSVLCIGKPRYSNDYEFEILRFCNKIDFTVVGGFSKLFEFFKKDLDPKSVITYCDKRFGTGSVYLNSNFTFLKVSNPGYFYVNFGKMKRYNRVCYQKKLLKEKLEIFDESLTEWQNMQLNGYDRIWDCGNNVFVWKNFVA